MGEETEQVVTGEALRELRRRTKMNRRRFCEYFKIPYRTEQDWELGARHIPEYLFDLIQYKLEKENMLELDESLEKVRETVEAEGSLFE